MITFTILLVLFVIAALYFWLIYAPHEHPDAKQLQGRYFAHRGLHDGNQKIPENSMEAFAAAVENGYGMELDVQLTSDDKLIVHHDATLKRVCNADVTIGDVTYEEICKHPLPNNTKVPLFSDVLKLVDGKQPLIIEIKHYRRPDETCRILWEQLKEYKGPYCIESFHPMCVRWFRKNAPQVLRGQLAPGGKRSEKSTIKPAVYGLLRHLLINFIGRPHFIAYEFAKDRHLSVYFMKYFFRPIMAAWTIRSQEALNKSMNKGYSMYIFELFTPED